MPSPQVTYIPAKTQLPINVMSTEALRRVAAYARVSTNSEEQKTSYEKQVEYYTQYIKAKDGWEFVKVYTDEGITAVNTKKREGFNEMVEHALAGKIDLIITKSVSRFARNTVDSLVTIRKLKAAGVEVYFEKENIYTLDSKGELLITLMSSLAQEESRSISENVTWGKRRCIAKGDVHIAYKHFLGYRKGPNGLPEIVEEEAKIVRLIYRLFLFGKSPNAIASMLNAEGIPSPSGRSKWRANTVESILTNEKYKGDALLQKTYTVDFLTKKVKRNNGEVPQVYVKDSHPAIIASDVFDLVQWEIKERKASARWASSAHVLSGKVFCGDCGGMYGSKIWHSTSKYRRMVWECNDKKRGAGCNTPHLSEAEIKAAFVTVFNQQLSTKAEILGVYEDILAAITNTAKLEQQAVELQNEIDVVMDLARNLIKENARVAQDQSEYTARYNAYMERYEQARQQKVNVEEELQARNAKRINITRYLDALKSHGQMLSEFDEEIWYTTVDCVTVFADERLTFRFKDGSEHSLASAQWRMA